MKKMVIIINILIMIMLISTQLYGQQVISDVFDVFFDINGQYTGSLPELGRDEVEALKWVHSDEEGGVIPSDICYVPSENLLFVYGDRRISVIDAISESIINTIDISDYGHWKYYPRTEEREKRIIYNPVNNKIYCATESMEILVINPQNGGQIEDTVIVPLPTSYLWMMLEIDEVNNNLYWSISAYSSNDTYLTVIDCTTNSILLNTIVESRIYDMKKHPVLNKIYFAQDNGISVRQATSPYNEINFYATSENIGVIEILYNEEQNLDTVVFCERDRANSSQEEIYILDENTGSFSSIDNLDFSFFSSSCYAKEENKLYLGFQQTGVCGIMILDDSFQILDLIYFQSSTDDPCDILYNSNTRKVFCGSIDNMYVIDGENNNIINEYDFENNILYRLALCENINKVFATNYKVYNIESFSGEGVHLNTINVGGRVYKSCYNEMEMKVYFYEKIMSNMDNAKVYIFDIETESFEILEIGHSISDIEYNQVDHLLYISNFNSNIIRVFDVRNNHNELTPIQLLHFWVNGIKITPNNKIFCITKTGIEIWNLTNINYEEYIPYGAFYEYSNGCLRAGYNEIYITIINPENSSLGRIYVIDTETNNVITVFHDIDSPTEIIYDSIHDQMYLYQQNYFFTVNGFICINCQDFTYETIVTEEPVIYLELAENLNKIYVTPYNYDGYVYEYSTETNEHLQTHQTTGVARVTKFNPLNNKLYVIIPFNLSNNNQTEIWTIDCETSQISGMGLEQFERNRGSLVSVLVDVVINEDNNKLYFGTGHSNIAIVQCEDSETKTLSSGWNWESFPRLERDETVNEAEDIIPILETIEPFNDISLIDLRHYQEQLTYDPDNFWLPQSYDIQSTWLYKIDINPSEERTLELYGSRMAEDFVIEDTFEAGEYHWFGYWLPETLNMDDAFGGFWDNVLVVKAEEWTYWRDSQPRGDPTDPEPKPSSKIRPLEYGKGYMVRFEEDVENFHWNYSGLSVEGYERPISESFNYDEKPDYEVIDVMDIPENVIEIGVFQDTICVGAVVIEDSCAQILVYSESANRDPLPFNFEVVTGRSSNSPILNYEVLNFNTGKFEKDLLRSGCQEYSVVKLGEQGEPEEEIPVVTKPKLFSNYPNPFNPTTTISFSVPREEDIELTIYNIKGQKVKTLYLGIAEEGKHSILWNGKNTNNKSVSSGIYFYKLKTNNKELTRKMLMMK